MVCGSYLRDANNNKLGTSKPKQAASTLRRKAVLSGFSLRLDLMPPPCVGSKALA